MSYNTKLLIVAVMVGLLLTVIACSGCNSHMVRVYTEDYRITGYNNIKDVSCQYFTTQTMYNVLLIKKD